MNFLCFVLLSCFLFLFSLLIRLVRPQRKPTSETISNNVQEMTVESCQNNGHSTHKWEWPLVCLCIFILYCLRVAVWFVVCQLILVRDMSAVQVSHNKHSHLRMTNHHLISDSFDAFYSLALLFDVVSSSFCVVCVLFFCVSWCFIREGFDGSFQESASSS